MSKNVLWLDMISDFYYMIIAARRVYDNDIIMMIKTLYHV